MLNESNAPEIVVDGIKTNIPLHRDLTRDEHKLAGENH